MSRKRLITIILIGTATLGILYLGYRVIGRQTAQPLQRELLKVEGVKEVVIIKAKQGQPSVIRVTPKPTSNLAYLYQQIEAVAERKLSDFEIEVVTPPNRDAELLFSNLSLLFYGGLARGDYEAMAGRMSQAAQKQGWKIDIQMDDKRVYVVMHHKDTVWYRVVNRYPDPLKEENSS